MSSPQLRPQELCVELEWKQEQSATQTHVCPSSWPANIHAQQGGPGNMKSNLWGLSHNSAHDPIQDTGQQIQSL